MGIIIRQSIKGTVVVYTGVILAFVINLFIFPLCFSKGEIGLLRVLADIGMFIAGMAAVGMQPSAIFRFFPYFQNDSKGHNGFFWLITLVPLAGFIVFIAVFYLFQGLFIKTFGNDSPLLTHYSYLLIPISFGLMMTTSYESYANANLRIVVPKILREIALRIIIIAFALLYLYKYINFDAFSWVYTLSYIAIAVFILFYIKKLGKLYLNPISFPSAEVRKDMIRYGTFMFLGGVGSLLVNSIDALMIAASPHGDENNGVYLTMVLLASMIELPGRSIGQISAPIVATHMKDENLPEVQKLYQSTSVIQLSVGCLLFTLLWCNIDNIFELMPNGKEYAVGKYCVLFIGLSQLFNMVTSLNGAILGLSKYFKFGFYAMLGIGIISVFINYLLISTNGILGASIARAINILLYQFTIFFFLYLKTKLSPFTKKSILPVVIMGIAMGISYIIPYMGNAFVDTAIRSLLIIASFVGLSLWFNVSPYFKEILAKGLQKVGIKQ